MRQTGLSHHYHLTHLSDGGAKRVLPPLGRLVERGVLACRYEVQPNDSHGLIFEEGLERTHEIQKLNLLRMADKPSGRLDAWVTFLSHLRAQR